MHQLVREMFEVRAIGKVRESNARGVGRVIELAFEVSCVGSLEGFFEPLQHVRQSRK